MSEDQLENDVLRRAGMDRRNFIKKIVVGTAFAVPVVVSFDMLTSTLASGRTCSVPNSTAQGTSGSGTQGGSGGTRQGKGGPSGQGSCGGTPDGGTGGAPAQGFSSDRAVKSDVTPVAWG